MLLYWGPDFMDPHSNAEAFAYNADNADDNYQSTTTWRNGWAVPDGNERADQGRPRRARSRPSATAMYIDLQKKVQAKSPIVIMFQAATQVAMAKNVRAMSTAPPPTSSTIGW